MPLTAPTVEVVAGALYLLSYIPLFLKLKWRRVEIEREQDGVIEMVTLRDPCLDVSLTSQWYFLIAASIRYYSSILRDTDKIMSSFHSTISKLAPPPNSNPTRAEVLHTVVTLFSKPKLQNLLVQGVSLAAIITVVTLLSFAKLRHAPRGTVFSKIISLLPPLVALSITASVFVNTAGKIPVNEKTVSFFGAALGAAAIIPQAIGMGIRKDANEESEAKRGLSSAPSMSTAVHFALNFSAKLLPGMIWFVFEMQKVYPKIQNDPQEAMVIANGIATPEYAATIVCILFSAIALWNATAGQKWILAVSVAMFAALVQVFGPSKAISVSKGDLDRMREYAILLEFLTFGAMIMTAGFSYIQSFYAVICPFMYFAGMLPSSWDEAVSRVNARIGTFQNIMAGSAEA
ncbi:hypothetical protein AAMO2058_000433300 [Amorphochlora amoebiformis]